MPGCQRGGAANSPGASHVAPNAGSRDLAGAPSHPIGMLFLDSGQRLGILVLIALALRCSNRMVSVACLRAELGQ